jgi:hypothetical protein
MTAWAWIDRNPAPANNKSVASSDFAACYRMCAAALILLACSQDCNVAAAQPADFGFRFERGACMKERFDTFSGVLTKDLGGGKIVTTRMSLSDPQMKIIYEAIQSIGFLTYPSDYRGTPGVGESIMTIPYETYRLEVRIGGVTHAVSWEDAFKPTTKEADRLRGLIDTITAFIHNHPNFRRLPRSSFGCL